MAKFEILKHEITETQPKSVHKARDFKDGEDFIHIALSQPENIDCLYSLNFGDNILSAYRMIDGKIICKKMTTVSDCLAA